jgi:AraC-like DNA-binding protein
MPAAMVRAQALRGYRQLVADLGSDPARLLRRAGITVSALDQLTGLISFEAMIDLLECSAAELGCPDFGLRLADRQDLGTLGTLAVAMRYSATVGDALRCAAKHLDTYNPAIGFTIRSGDQRGQARLDFRLLHDHPRSWAQTAEHGIGLGWRTVNLLCEGRCRLRGVWLPHPAVGPEIAYRSRFPARLTFDADRAALAFDATALELAISGHNSELYDAATHYLDTHNRPEQDSCRVQVRQTIEHLLGTGTCSCQHVAHTLHMHPRTLQRRLREEGTTFEDIKDDTRRDLAQRYLAHPGVSLTQVTALLDYREQSALGRSVQRWFHTTPRSLRDSLTTRSAPATA